MKSFMLAFCIVLLNGCSVFSTYGLHPSLLDSEQYVVDCNYEMALDTLQKFTVIGSNKEKTFSFELMGIIYQEKKKASEFNHTVERFLFSKMGRGVDRAWVIETWNGKRQKIREKRRDKMGVLECKSNAMGILSKAKAK